MVELLKNYITYPAFLIDNNTVWIYGIVFLTILISFVSFKNVTNFEDAVDKLHFGFMVLFTIIIILWMLIVYFVYLIIPIIILITIWYFLTRLYRRIR